MKRQTLFATADMDQAEIAEREKDSGSWVGHWDTEASTFAVSNHRAEGGSHTAAGACHEKGDIGTAGPWKRDWAW